MASPKKPLNPNSVLGRAAAARDKAQNFIDRQAGRINNDYRKASKAYKAEAAKADARIKMVGDTVDRLFPVSDEEVNAALQSLGINPNATLTGSSATSRGGSPSRTHSSVSGVAAVPGRSLSHNAAHDRMLSQAKQRLVQAERRLAKEEPRTRAEYARVNKQFDGLGRQLDAVQEVLSRPVSGGVSPRAVDELMESFAQQSTADLLARAPSVKGLPEPGSRDQAERVSVPAPAKRVAPMPSMQPNPHQAKIDALEKQQQQFMAQRKDLGSANVTSAYMPKLKAAVALVDKTYGTNSMAHYNKLQARYDQLQEQVRHAKTLAPAAREALKEKFEKDTKAFKNDLKTYTAAVAKTYDKHIEKSGNEMAGLKEAAASSQQSSGYSTPRPRGPGR